ncbi:MAG: PIN-like domain-containing protein [Chloroflexi bacterium]|nr:PIN-like domain-containing protein [Chloroflexota bacterium]
MLALRRLPPERGQALLAILEELIDQVWMPLQFYTEWRENLASAHRENKKDCHSFKKRADSCRDKSLNLVKDFVRKTQLHVDPRIVDHLERGFALLDEGFPALLQPNLHDYDDLERRIDTLLRGKERKELPESLREYIPSLWARPPSRSNPPNRQPIAPAPITATERFDLFIVDFSFDHFL